MAPTPRTGTPGPLLAAAVALLVLAGACESGDGDPSATPTPRDQLTASPVDTPAPAPTGTASPSPTTSPSPTASPSPREPTDTDRARFVQDYSPEGATDLDSAAEDVDGDGIREIVFVYVRSGARVSHVDVAWWDAEEQEYAVQWGADGGRADRIDRFRLADVNDDGRLEIVLDESAGSSAASLTLWGADPDTRTFSPLVAAGGCHAGSHTYGEIGAELRNDDEDAALELFATCEDNPLPPAAWSTDVYDWVDGAYHYERTVFPGEGG